MLALRRAHRVATPLGVRTNATFISKMKAQEAAAVKMAATLPDDLKPIVSGAADTSAEIESFIKANPELVELVLAKAAEVEKPGIVATVAAPKDPGMCKYTEEGTMAHTLMQSIAKTDRAMAALAGEQIKTPAAIKAAFGGIAAKFEADVKAAGGDAKDYKALIDLIPSVGDTMPFPEPLVGAGSKKPASGLAYESIASLLPKTSDPKSMVADAGASRGL